MNKTYIGDGVYASFDGWQIKLETLEGNVIYLEGPVVDNLFKYANHCFNNEIKKDHEGTLNDTRSFNDRQ